MADPEVFAGRTVLLVGGAPPGPAVGRAFERVGEPRVVTHAEGGHVVARWTVTVCHGFRGFPAVPATRY